MVRRVSRILALPALLLASLTGCLSGYSSESAHGLHRASAANGGPAPPYRQGLIDPEWDPLEVAGAEPWQAAHRQSGSPLLTRCRRLEGRQLAATDDEAQRELLRLCLGRVFKLDLQVGREPLPRPPYLVLFDEAKPSPEQSIGRVAGVVLSVAGDQVEFLYLRNTRAHRGVLNLRHPNSRRDADGKLENSYVRIVQRGDPQRTRHLAGQLLAGFAATP